MRPRNRTHIDDRMKLHLRVRELGGTTLRILTPRPGLDVRLATNRFHGTWHILSDRRGTQLLARLLWGLAFQRQPGTVILLDAPFMVPNPFDGDPSDPIVLVPWHLTGAKRSLMRALRDHRTRLGPSDRSVRWLTRGLDHSDYPPYHERWSTQQRFERSGGFLIYRADPVALRCAALSVAALDGETDYTYLTDDEGEVQIFADFRRRLGEAARARAALGLPQGRSPESLREPVWARSLAERARRCPE